jgi:hypothetical protein
MKVRRILVLSLVLSSFAPLLCAAAGPEKLKAEDVIARHLESIGSAEAREAARTRSITGTARVLFRQGGRGYIDGDARLASSGEKSLISMLFNSLDYPYEKLAFDGVKVTTSQVRPGVRTLLGRYLFTNDVVMREGLLGGTLSSAWPFLNMSARNARLQYDGLKKVAGQQLHQLRYNPPKTPEVRITLFFEPETFRHLKTQYYQAIPAEVGTNKPADSVSQEETRVTLVEIFSEFSAESGLTLPHTYRLQYEVLSPRSSLLYEWSLTIKQFTFGQPVDSKEFDIRTN